jgi:hypothetical protein
MPDITAKPAINSAAHRNIANGRLKKINHSMLKAMK